MHGYLDYIVGLLLIAAPFLFGFADGGPAQWVPVLLGTSVIVYSLFTAYELGVVRVIPLGFHLGLDALGGVFLAVSPWLFGFSEFVWVPHALFGVLEVLAAAMTRTVVASTDVRRPVGTGV